MSRSTKATFDAANELTIPYDKLPPVVADAFRALVAEFAERQKISDERVAKLEIENADLRQRVLSGRQIASIKIIEIDAARRMEEAFLTKKLGNLNHSAAKPREGGLAHQTMIALKEAGYVINNDPLSLNVPHYGYGFSDGHPKIILGGSEGVRDAHVFVFYTSRLPERSVFTVDGVFDAGAYNTALTGLGSLEQRLVEDVAIAVKKIGARKPTIVAPYLARARDDRPDQLRTVAGVEITLKRWNKLFKNLIVAHPHCQQNLSAFDGPTYNITPQDIIVARFLRDHVDKLKSEEGLRHLFEEWAFCCPDNGAFNMVKLCAKTAREASITLYLHSTGKYTEENFKHLNDTLPKFLIGPVDKTRKAPGASEVNLVAADVTGKKMIMIDDIIDSGGTTCNAAEALYAAATKLAKSGVEPITVYSTHMIASSDAVQTLDKCPAIGKIIFTNSVGTSAEVANAAKHEIISLDKMLANIIINITSPAHPNVIFNPEKRQKRLKRVNRNTRLSLAVQGVTGGLGLT